MKLSISQKKQLADRIAKFYSNFVGVEYGYFITPLERKKLSAFAMRILRLLNCKKKNYSSVYINLCYKKTLKNFQDVILCFCASLIVYDILQIDFEFVPAKG